MSAVVAGAAGSVVAAKTMMAKMRLKKRPMLDVSEPADETAPVEDPATETVDEPTL